MGIALAAVVEDVIGTDPRKPDSEVTALAANLSRCSAIGCRR